MQIDHAQVAGILNKAPLDPGNFQPVVGVRSIKPDVEARLVKESYGWDSTRIECGGPATVCEPNPQTLLRGIRKQILLSEV